MHSDNPTPVSLGLPPSPSRQPRVDTDEQLSALLRALPRDEAGLGFEERVLRRVHAAPTPPLTFARGLRLAAPLVVAAALGFVIGPSLLERGEGSTDVAAGQIATASQNAGASSTPPPRPLPVTTRQPTRGQIVANTGANPGAGAASLRSPQMIGSSLSQFRAEAARVRQELEALRRTSEAAGPTVTVMMLDGVEVQVDIHELLEALEERAREMAAARRQHPNAWQETAKLSVDSEDTSSPIEPPLW